MCAGVCVCMCLCARVCDSPFLNLVTTNRRCTDTDLAHVFNNEYILVDADLVHVFDNGIKTNNV